MALAPRRRLELAELHDDAGDKKQNTKKKTVVRHKKQKNTCSKTVLEIYTFSVPKVSVTHSLGLVQTVEEGCCTLIVSCHRPNCPHRSAPSIAGWAVKFSPDGRECFLEARSRE